MSVTQMEPLDRAILNWVEQHTGDGALSQQISMLRVRKRDYMRTGFFIYFDLPENAPGLPDGLKPICPHIVAPNLPDGAGCDLFVKAGRLHYMEIYARGGFFPPDLEQFELQPES